MELGEVGGFSDITLSQFQISKLRDAEGRPRHEDSGGGKLYAGVDKKEFSGS